uniref:Uncharacterized protein n=1 Tax=Sphaerodactylus townsendi TaxID=933632 RepID=A0ACB8F4K8_9SAUR
MEPRRTHTTAAVDDSVDGTERAPDREANHQQQAYEALWLHNKEVTREQDQLKADLSTLQSQVAYLMVGSYMEIHGDGFKSDCNRVLEIGT